MVPPALYFSLDYWENHFQLVVLKTSSLDLNKFKFNKFERGKSNWKQETCVENDSVCQQRTQLLNITCLCTPWVWLMSSKMKSWWIEFGHKYPFGVQKEKIYLSTFRARKNYFSTFPLFWKISKNTFLLFHFSRNGKVTFLFARKVSFLPTPGLNN